MLVQHSRTFGAAPSSAGSSPRFRADGGRAFFLGRLLGCLEPYKILSTVRPEQLGVSWAALAGRSSDTRRTAARPR